MEHVRRISTPQAFSILVVVFLLLYLVRPVLLPFVLSGAIAYAADPAVEWLSARAGWRRWISASIVFVVLVGILAGFVLLVVPTLTSEFLPVARNLQGVLKKALVASFGDGEIRFLGSGTTADDLAARATSSLREWLVAGGNFLSLATMGSVAIFGVFLFLALLIYFLIGGPGIGRGLLWIVPPAQRPLVAHMWSRVDPVLRRYFIGLAAVVAYASAAAYVGLGLVLQLPGAVVLSILTGLLELVPMVGPAASAVLAGIVAIQSASGFGAIAGYAAYAAALRISIDQFVGPLVLGRSAYLHPVLIIFCFLAGGYLFSVVGLILAVPVALTIRIVLHELYDDTAADLPALAEVERHAGAQPGPEPSQDATSRAGREHRR